jgi:hypothetical protein
MKEGAREGTGSGCNMKDGSLFGVRRVFNFPHFLCHVSDGIKLKLICIFYRIVSELSVWKARIAGQDGPGWEAMADSGRVVCGCVTYDSSE